MSQVSDLRMARVFDGRNEVGRPIVNRPPIDNGAREPLLAYLESAPVVFAARSLDADEFSPAESDVPLNYRTDGVWMWAGSVPHYLRKHGLPPEPELVRHIIDRGFRVGSVDEARLELAISALAKPHMESLTPVRPAPVVTPAPPSKSGATRGIAVAAGLALAIVLIVTAAAVALLTGRESGDGAAAQTSSVPPAPAVPSIRSTTPIGPQPTDIAVEGKTAFITDFNDGTLWMIDTSTMTTTGVLPIGAFPEGVAADPEAGAVYVATFDGVKVVATRKYGSPAVDAVIPLGNTNHIAVDPSANAAYVTTGNNRPDYTLTTIDTNTNLVTGVIDYGTLGGEPIDVAVNPVTHDVYVVVSDSVTGTAVKVIDPVTRTVTATIPYSKEKEAKRIVADPGGGQVHALVCDRSNKACTVDAVDTRTKTTTGSVPLGRGAVDLAIDSVNHSIYVSTMASTGNGVSVIDTAANTVASSVDRGSSQHEWKSPDTMAVDPQTNAVYIIDFFAHQLVVVKR